MSISIDYPLLDALTAVVREGSFERAAQSLHVTSSAVSQRIKLLEERMGCALVVRSQPARPTEVGLVLCRHAEQVRLLEHDLRERMPSTAVAHSARSSGSARATLRVAVNADSLATWFVQALGRFTQETNDQVLVDVVVDDQDHTAQWLHRGEVLAAVTAHEAVVPGCRSHPIAPLVYAATASPGFMQRHFARGVNAKTLAAAPSLRFSRQDALQQRWVQRVCRRDVPLQAHWLPSTQAFVEAALAGVGWGLNPLGLVHDHLAAGRLVELLPGVRLQTPLAWQATRMSAGALDRLGDAVMDASKAWAQRWPARTPKLPRSE